ncbi:MAG: outer membrane protein assembly factor BamE, partial [Burkholderiales bacterium]
MSAARFCRLLAVVAGLCLTLGACQKVPMLPGLKPYRMDIQQGNVVTQEMVAKLKPGMTRQQVRFVMGTPPIADAFHQ